jgi:hypothetical protein
MNEKDLLLGLLLLTANTVLCAFEGPQRESEIRICSEI